MSTRHPLSGYVINAKWKIGRKLGSGSFGEVHIATDIQTGEDVAVKMELCRVRCPQLHYESRLLRQLGPAIGIAKLHHFGQENDHNVLVMELMGHSLEDTFTSCNRKFTLKTFCSVAYQMLERVEHLHSKYFIHRDIKPDNFMTGYRDTSHLIYMIDFGLAKRYRDTRGNHIPSKENKALTGTARYASKNAHLGNEQSRRDDLEAIGYVLVYFYKGSLPWQGIKANGKSEKYSKIMEKKIQLTNDQLCRGCPTEVATYMNYVAQLRFEDQPDYAYLRSIFHDLIANSKQDFFNPVDLDWILLRNRRSTNSPYTRTTDKQIKNGINQLDVNNIKANNGAVQGEENPTIEDRGTIGKAVSNTNREGDTVMALNGNTATVRGGLGTNSVYGWETHNTNVTPVDNQRFHGSGGDSGRDADFIKVHFTSNPPSSDHLDKGFEKNSPFSTGKFPSSNSKNQQQQQQQQQLIQRHQQRENSWNGLEMSPSVRGFTNREGANSSLAVFAGHRKDYFQFTTNGQDQAISQQRPSNLTIAAYMAEDGTLILPNNTDHSNPSNNNNNYTLRENNSSPAVFNNNTLRATNGSFHSDSHVNNHQDSASTAARTSTQYRSKERLLARPLPTDLVCSFPSSPKKKNILSEISSVNQNVQNNSMGFLNNKSDNQQHQFHTDAHESINSISNKNLSDLNNYITATTTNNNPHHSSCSRSFMDAYAHENDHCINSPFNRKSSQVNGNNNGGTLSLQGIRESIRLSVSLPGDRILAPIGDDIDLLSTD